MNQPPEYCPYCGTAVTPVDSPVTTDAVDTPMSYECDAATDALDRWDALPDN